MLVVAMAAGALVLLIDGGEAPAGDSGSEAATEVQAEPDAIATDAAEATSETGPRDDGRDNGGSGSQHGQRDPEPDAAGAPERDEDQGSSEPERRHRDRDHEPENERASECPPGLSNDQCAALAGDLGGGGSKPAEGCPPTLSESECTALYQDYEASGASDEVGPRECPPGLSRQLCAQLAQAIEAGG